MPFKTKDNVVHAGLSHLLQPWKELTSLKLDPFLSFLNNNSLIVIHNQVDVTEVLKLGLLNTQKLLDKSSKLTIHTLLEMESVNMLRQKEKLMLYHMFKFQREVLINLKLQLMLNQLVYQLKPTLQFSNLTLEVSQIPLNVEQILTMLSLQLVMELKMELITQL